MSLSLQARNGAVRWPGGGKPPARRGSHSDSGTCPQARPMDFWVLKAGGRDLDPTAKASLQRSLHTYTPFSGPAPAPNPPGTARPALSHVQEPRLTLRSHPNLAHPYHFPLDLHCPPPPLLATPVFQRPHLSCPCDSIIATVSWAGWRMK